MVMTCAGFLSVAELGDDFEEKYEHIISLI